MRDLQGVVTGLIQGAVTDYSSYRQGSDRQVMDLYKGVRRDYPDVGDLTQVPGRSGSMSTDIRDAVLHLMPRLIKTIIGPGKVVRFDPAGPGDAGADLVTEMVRHVISRDNRGYFELFSAIWDALVLDVGWMRWEWIESGIGEQTFYQGVTEDQIVGLITMPGVDDYRIVNGPYQEGQQLLYDCVLVSGNQGRIKVEAVPSEEMFHDGRARHLQEADCVAHVREVPADKIVAMGYDKDEVAKHAGRSSTAGSRGYGIEYRRRGSTSDSPIHEDDSRRLVTFADAWIRVDLDGDGISELRHFHCIGSQYQILNGHGIIVNRVPVAELRTIIEPHTMKGLGHGTLLADVQVQKSLMERGFMNAQAKALDSRLVVKEDAVRYEDVVEGTGLHDPIRVLEHHNVGDAVSELKTQYTGDIALEGLNYLNQKRADRSGMARAAEGKDAQALQSTTQQAVTETFSRADSMTVLVLLTLIEEGLKDLYNGIADMLRRHQGHTRRLLLEDGRFVDIGPETFMIRRESRVNVRGWDAVREIEYLGLILTTQKDLRESGSPLVNDFHIGNTVRGIIRATGRFNVSDYIMPWSMEDQARWEAEQQRKAAEAPPPIEQQVVDVEKAKLMLEADFDREKLSVEAALKELEIGAKWGMTLAEGQLEGWLKTLEGGEEEAQN